MNDFGTGEPAVGVTTTGTCVVTERAGGSRCPVVDARRETC
jgi:hypothetical protein